MIDSKKLDDDRRTCMIVGLILAAIATAILIWILSMMGLSGWLLVILTLVIAVALFYWVGNYCRTRAEAASAAAQEAAQRAAGEQAAAEERAAKEAAEAAEAERRRAEAEAQEAAERAEAEQRAAREAAEVAEAERRRAEAEAQEASVRAATEQRAAQEAAEAAEVQRLVEGAERAAAERAAAEQRAAREAAEAAEAQRRRAEAEAHEAAEGAAEQTATSSPNPATATPATSDLDRGGTIEDIGEDTRPAALAAPRGGSADDLTKIKGIGAKLERLCNQLGFYHFDQIAGWTASEVAWVDSNLQGFKGRVTRENWVEQAKTLAAGGETEFSRRANQG